MGGWMGAVCACRRSKRTPLAPPATTHPCARAPAPPPSPPHPPPWRSAYVPEEMRATIINVFRIPLNLFVCVVLYNVG